MTQLVSSAATAPFARGQLLAAALLIGFANGILSRIEQSLFAQGWALSSVNLFDVSAIIWLGLLAAAALFLSDRSAPSQLDYFVIIAAMFAFVVPWGHASWLGLTALAVYVLFNRPADPTRRGAMVTLAVCAAAFWGRAILHAVGDPLLEADAALASFLTGAERIGNTLQLNEGDPFVWIEPYCSSVTNLSLAILSVVLVVEWERLDWDRSQFLRVLLACAFVIFVNCLRISAVLVFPEQFELIHGPRGAMAVSWILVIGLAPIALSATHATRRPA